MECKSSGDPGPPLHSGPLLFLGLIFGLVSAVSHSLAYLASRWFTVSGRGTSWQLLVIVHIQLGLLSAAGMGFAWPSGLDFVASWAVPALAASVVLMLSQATFFWVLRHVDASTLAPLMSVKMAVIALMTIIGIYGPGQPVSVYGWLGVGLAIAAAFLIQGLGAAPALKTWGWIVAMFFGYAFCDVSISRAIDVMVEEQLASGAIVADTPGARLHAATFAATIVYGGTGVLSLIASPWLGTRSPKAWRDALPYTLCWSVAMVALYAAFGMLGVVYGAILQSTRSLWSVVLGWFVARLGDHGIETAHQNHVMVWRILAALLMIAAVAIFALGK